MAAGRPHNISVLQFLLDEGCPWHNTACCNSADVGDFEQVRWLHQHGAALGDDIAECAASSAGVSDFAWLVQQPGVQLEPVVMEVAAGRGDLELCQWLHSVGCPCDDEACAAAAEDGHLSTFRFLHENVCPAGVTSWHSALLHDPESNTEVLQYLMDHVALTEAADLTEALVAAGQAGALAVAQHLRQRGAEWPVYLNAWSPELIEWARAEGCTVLAESSDDDDDDDDSDVDL